MKLLFCPKCTDVRKLAVGDRTTCWCGESWGWYEDDCLHAVYGGDALPVGISNQDFYNAYREYKNNHGSHVFAAFTIPDSAITIRREVP